MKKYEFIVHFDGYDSTIIVDNAVDISSAWILLLHDIEYGALGFVQSIELYSVV